MDDFYKKTAFSSDFDGFQAISHEIVCNIFFDGPHFYTSVSPVVQYFCDIQKNTQMRAWTGYLPHHKRRSERKGQLLHEFKAGHLED